MTNILERLTRREMVVRKDRKEMDEGETWVHPVQLRKGKRYSVNAACSGKGVLKCSVFNSDEKAPFAESGMGRKTSFAVTPEEDGLYRLFVEREPTGNGSAPEKVTVTVKVGYVPSRVRAWVPAE